MNYRDDEKILVPVPAYVESIATQVVDAAYAVHKALGPGLLENVYETCLAHEILKRNMKIERQIALPIEYDGLILDDGLRLDLLVDKKLIVELKTVDAILSVHKAQLKTYLKLSGLRLGLLINFNVVLIKDGIKRIVVH